MNERDHEPPSEERALAAQIARLGAAIDDALRPYLPPDGSYALLDFPDHSNVGDSAIWMGEIECLERLCGVAPRYVAARSKCDWERLKTALPSGPIFLSGGGNFGDIWPEQQTFREEALDRLQGRLVVQLPQSIHFSDEAALRRAAAAIERHGNFVLLVRDKQSFAIAKAAFSCRIELVPDMALALGVRARHGTSRHELVMVLRKDREKNPAAPTAAQRPPKTLVRDWVPPKEPGLRQWTWVQTLLECGPSRSDDARDAWREHYYRKLAKARLSRGIALLSTGRFVVSDRLHVHILCTLLDIPHATLDQSYGKTSAFIGSWTKAFGPGELCSNLDEALQNWRRRRGPQTSARSRP
jgi:pyruvyl transferase EpsO